MNTVRITFVVQLSDTLLLVIVKNPENGKRDAILLTTPRENALLSECIESLEQSLSFPDDIQSGYNSKHVTFEIDKRLFDTTEVWCAETGITIDQLALAFIRFCACKENHTALKEWLNPKRLAAELCSTIDELLRIQAELSEIKQRFGLDKQEAFLEEHANITLKEFAAMLHGRDCQPNLSQNELLLAKQRGFVVVYGDSDDRVEFEGAIREEGHTNPLAKPYPAGVLVLSENGKLLDEDSELYAKHVKENRNVITVYYCYKDNLNWVFETDLPHETFLTYDGGYDEEYCDFDDGFARCIIFKLSSLSAQRHITCDS